MFTASVKRREAQDKGGCLSVRMSVIVSTCFLSTLKTRQGIEKVSCLPGYAIFVNNTKKRHLLCFLYYFSVCKSFKELAFLVAVAVFRAKASAKIDTFQLPRKDFEKKVVNYFNFNVCLEYTNIKTPYYIY